LEVEHPYNLSRRPQVPLLWFRRSLCWYLDQCHARRSDGSILGEMETRYVDMMDGKKLQELVSVLKPETFALISIFKEVIVPKDEVNVLEAVAETREASPA
jgi:hypothetical protein